MGEGLGAPRPVARFFHGSDLQTLPELSTPPKINLAAIDVRRILKTCKNNDRMVLQRHYLEGFKVQEIAQEQGWTETAVRIRLLRARRTVGKRLGRKYPEPGATKAAALAEAAAVAA